MKYLFMLGCTFTLIISANSALAQSIGNAKQVDRSTTSIVNKDLAKEMYDRAKVKEVDFNEFLERVAAYNNAINLYNKMPLLNNGYRQGYGGFEGDLDRLGILADYNKAIELCPECVVYYYDRGNFKSKLNDLSGALADYNKAIELSPKYAEAYYERSFVKRELNQSDSGDGIRAYELFRERRKLSIKN
jgi:tetratricopeptide (TPR) repeat protein